MLNATRLAVRCAMQGVPNEVMEMLFSLVGNNTECAQALVDTSPDVYNHPLFKTDNWYHILGGVNPMYAVWRNPQLDCHRRTVSINVAWCSDHTVESILLLLDWISPYIRFEEGQVVAVGLTDTECTQYYIENGEIAIKTTVVSSPMSSQTICLDVFYPMYPMSEIIVS